MASFMEKFTASPWSWWSSSIVVIALSAAVLWRMGRVPYCECSYIRLWHDNVWSSENSQHLTDWYTFSHIIHGFIFYWLLWKLFPKMSFGRRLFYATLIEVSWEVFENTNFIINRYRDSTISLDYYGDSIINSVMDSLSAVLGFWLASRLPIKVTIALMILMEVVTGYVIHDNLLLNVIMLLYPLDVIKVWQLSIK